MLGQHLRARAQEVRGPRKIARKDKCSRIDASWYQSHTVDRALRTALCGWSIHTARLSYQIFCSSHPILSLYHPSPPSLVRLSEVRARCFAIRSVAYVAIQIRSVQTMYPCTRLSGVDGSPQTLPLFMTLRPLSALPLSSLLQRHINSPADTTLFPLTWRSRPALHLS